MRCSAMAWPYKNGLRVEPGWRSAVTLSTSAHHAALRFSVTQQGFQRGQLAYIQVFARAPEVALNTPFNKRNQAALHGGAYLVGQCKLRLHAGCFVRGGQQVIPFLNHLCLGAKPQAVL